MTSKTKRRRCETITVYLLPAELEILNRAATLTHTPISVWARSQLLLCAGRQHRSLAQIARSNAAAMQLPAAGFPPAQAAERRDDDEF